MPSKHLVSLVTFLAISSSFVLFLLLHESTHQLSPTDGEEELKDGGMVTWGRRRFVQEGIGVGAIAGNIGGNIPDVSNITLGGNIDKGDGQVLLLAKERTERRDPLNEWKMYTGGWNVTDMHYLASVAFTAVPFFICAQVWFVFFGIALCIMCICYCCRRKPPYGYSRIAYCVSLVSLIVFTLVAIAGCIVLYAGQEKFYDSTSKTLSYVLNEADESAFNLRNVSFFLEGATKIGLDTVILPFETQKQIHDGLQRVRHVADLITDKADLVAMMARRFLHYLKVALLIFATVMLLLVFCGFVLSLFGKRFLIYCLVIIGWILVTCAFILCGAFLLVHNVFGDACVSMDEWSQKKPTAYTSLDDFLPCVDKDVARRVLNNTREVNYAAVGVVDQLVRMANSNHNANAGTTPWSYNQSGPALPSVCNPYNEDFSDRACAPGEVAMPNVSVEWAKYICEVDEYGVCATIGRLTPTYFEQMTAFVNVSYGLYRYGPYFTDIADCTFVKNKFTDMLTQHCPGLILHSKWIYIGLLMVAVAVMMSMIFWVIYCRERRHRVYTKRIDGISSRISNCGVVGI